MIKAITTVILFLIGIILTIEKVWSPRLDKTREGHILLHYNKRKGRTYKIIYWNKNN